MAKRIIVNLYELDSEYMKENELYYKNRATAYVYDTKKVIDYAITEEQARELKIGDILEF